MRPRPGWSRARPGEDEPEAGQRGGRLPGGFPVRSMPRRLAGRGRGDDHGGRPGTMGAGDPGPSVRVPNLRWGPGLLTPTSLDVRARCTLISVQVKGSRYPRRHPMLLSLFVAVACVGWSSGEEPDTLCLDSSHQGGLSSARERARQASPVLLLWAASPGVAWSSRRPQAPAKPSGRRRPTLSPPPTIRHR
jgi:hypothetical protein